MLLGAPSSRNAASARSAAPSASAKSATAVHDHLGEQRIEVGIGAVAGIAVGIDAHARSRRRLEHRERAAARLGRAVRGHGLHVDRGAGSRGRAAAPSRPVLARSDAAGQPQLRLHQIDAPHLFGDGVLDLQARIGLDEEEVRSPSTRNSKVPRLRYFTALAMATAASTIFLRNAGLEVGAGRQLDDLLAAPLQGAFALAQRHDAALAVAHDLHLDVARAADQPLGIESAVAERRLGLGRGTRAKASAISPSVLISRMPRPPPPAMAFSAMPDFACFLKNAAAPARSIDVGARQHRHLALLRHGRGRAPCRRTVRAARASGRRRRSSASTQACAKSAFSDRSRSPDGPRRSRPSSPPRSRPRYRDRPPRLALQRDRLVDAPDVQRRGVVLGDACRPWRCRARPRPGRCGWRSRRDWRSGVS